MAVALGNCNNGSSNNNSNNSSNNGNVKQQTTNGSCKQDKRQTYRLNYRHLFAF